MNIYSVSLPVCVSPCPSVSQRFSIRVFTCLSASVCHPVSSSATLKTFLPVCWSVCVRVWLPFCLSINFSVLLKWCIPAALSLVFSLVFFPPQTFTVATPSSAFLTPSSLFTFSIWNSHSTSLNCFSPPSSPNIFPYRSFFLSFQFPTSPSRPYLAPLSRHLRAASNLINNNTMVVCHLLSQS